MGAKTLIAVSRAWIGMLALALSACGGGGGGDESPAPTRPSGATPMALSSNAMADQSTSALGASEAVLQIGQLVADYAVRYLVPGTPLSGSETCPNGGIVTVSLTDADSNQQASAGDTVLVDWQDCGLPLIGEVFSGRFKIDIDAATRGPTPSLTATAHLGRGATLLGTPAGITVQLLGSLAVTWTRSDFRTTLAVSSTAADDLRIVGTGGSVTLTDAYKALALRKELRFDEARSVVTLAMHYESDSLGGSLDVSTPQALKSYLNRYPETGRVEIRGAGAGVLAVTPNFVNANDGYTTSLDADGNGVTEAAGFVGWQDAAMGYLWWDGAGAPPWNGQPYPTQFYNSTDFVISGTFVDDPGIDDSYRLQFTRPPVNPPALQFRFRDAGSTVVFDGVFDNVAATAVRQGALYVLRPERPLRHARSYILDFSTDGQTWFSVATFRDALANSLTVSSGNFGFVTPDNLRAVITHGGGVLASAGASVQLDASRSVASSRPIVGYSWRQLNGTPLQFDTTQAAITTVRWGTTPPTGLENIVIELSVTDSAGDVEKTRTTIGSLNPASTGHVLYFRSTNGDYIGQGQTVLVGDTTGTFSGNPMNSSYLNFTYFGFAPDNGTWWTLGLAAGDGQPLRVGAYENAIRAPFAGNQNGVDFGGSGRGCNTISGRYDVLEIATDGNGNIARLAVDFEQHCEGPTAPPLFGSLRINSSIPIRP